MLIKPFLKMNQSKDIIEVESQKLEFMYQFIYDNDPASEYCFDKAMAENRKQDINELMASILDRNIGKYEHTRNCVLACNFIMMKRKKRLERPAVPKSNLWLLTFTLGPNDKPDKVKKRMLKSMEKYKFMYTEETGSKNGRYHIHVIAETFEKRGFEKGYNLKPTNDHQGRIDRKHYRYNNDELAKYLSKETPVKGDVEYIRNLIKQLPKSKN